MKNVAAAGMIQFMGILSINRITKHSIFITVISILYLDEHFFFISVKEMANSLVHTFACLVRPFRTNHE